MYALEYKKTFMSSGPKIMLKIPERNIDQTLEKNLCLELNRAQT